MRLSSPLLIPSISEQWPLLGGLLHVGLSLVVSAHVLLHKGSSRSAVGWFGLVWLSPVVGAALYLTFGINRLRRKALRLRGSIRALNDSLSASPPGPRPSESPLERFLDTVAPYPASTGNAVSLLASVDEACAAMLEAIAGAERSITLISYIFDRDALGMRFVEALGQAAARGVEVRVLVDGVGSLYSWPPITRALERRGVRCARFLWTWRPGFMAVVNMRNHRKILVIDGVEAFTGSMNIRAGFSEEITGAMAHGDLHFRVRGAGVHELQQVFAVDWAFTTGEELSGPLWFPALRSPAPRPPSPGEDPGGVALRVLPDGPDEDFGRAELAFTAGLSCAQRRVAIVTPYFLPEEGLLATLGAAQRRGVQVEVLVPEHNNLPFVGWAMTAELPKLLRHGVEVRQVSGPFNHGRYMVVDDTVSFIGSPNWDGRSMRLNFELLLVVHDEALATALLADFAGRRSRSEAFTSEALRARPLWSRLRGGLFRLWKPYL